MAVQYTLDGAARKLRDIARHLPEHLDTTVHQLALMSRRELERATRDAGHVETGKLAAGWRISRARGVGRGDARRVVQNLNPQAGLLSFGGTIRPVNRRALTVPIAPEARRGGALSFRDAFVKRIGDRAYIARRQGGRLRLLYELRSSVTIPGSRYLDRATEAIDRQGPAVIETALGSALLREVGR